jgi:hypothetical protein
MSYFNTFIWILVGYVVLVLLAELFIWRVQPTMDGGVTIVVTLDDGTRIVRNLFGFEHDGRLYISSNHWFRRWYAAALENPEIEVTREGITRPFTAVDVDGEEYDRLSSHYKMGAVLRFICGFAPSKFLRLDPLS